MNEQSPTFTHYGWFGFCPVKVADPYGGEPCLAARWLILEPLFDLQEVIQGAVIWLCSAMDAEYEPMWRIKITGEYK